MGGGNFRHRKSNKTGVKFSAGNACESNPTKSKHRSAALAARNASYGGAGMLAVEDRPMNTAADDMLAALPIHSMDIGSSSKSMVSEGGLSKLTEFTACTNPAFDSVNRVWKSGSSIQAEVVSVLAAIAEVIKERDGKESDVEYCAALMTALEGSSLGNPRRTAAIAYLLHLIILYTKLLENVDSTEGSALKNLISVLGIILRAQPASVWASANTRNMLVSVAALAAHDKPWVRTMARRVIRAVVTDPVTATDNGLHPASGAVGQLILSNIESYLARSNGDNTTVVRFLCLLEGIMHKMPAALFKQMAEAMLKCFAISDSMVKCSSLQCLHRALQRQPCDSALPTETNSLLLAALRQLGSSVTDVTVTAYWMQALAEAHVCLTAKDSKKSIQHAFQSLPLFVKIFESGNEQLAQVTYQSLTRVIENCVQDDAECGKFLLAQLHEAMTMKSASVWKFILRAQMKLYEACGDGLEGPELTKVMEDLSRLRQSDDCFCKTELDFTIGAAVRHIGVAHVMNILSLEIDPDAAILSTDFTRSWLLPVLRVNIHNAPIALFTTHFLPIAMKIHRRLPTLQPQVQRLYNTFQFQLWELLPSFCESPSDLETSFPDIAPILGAALNERKDLRMTVLNAIRRALRFSLQPDASSERVEVMSRYAKNFMPIFFNMYVGSVVDGGYDDKGVRLSVLEAIRLYTEVTPSDLITRYVDSAISKSKDNDDSSNTTASQKQARVLDILCAMARVAETDDVSKILDTILPWFDSSDMNGLQKKAYRILEEVVQRRSSPEIESLLENRNDYVENAVLKPIESISFPARASYCSCVHMLFDGCKSMKEVTELTEKLISNIILLLDKDNNVHTRQNASKCIQFVCNKLLDLVEDPTVDTPAAVLDPVLSKIYELTTLAADQKNTTKIPLNVARSCLVAANIIGQKQIKVLNTVATSKMISFACSWLAEGRAAVRILAIRLMRVLCQKIPEVVLQQFREQILTTVFEGQLTSDLTVKVRKANRLLLEVLVEKFGVNVLEKYTDKPDWLKQMKNIEKIRKRKIRKAAAGDQMDQDGDDEDGASAISGSNVSGRTAGADTILELLEDSDEENESDSEEQLMKKSRVGSVWLKNEADGDVPMDLLDSSRMIDQITTMNPAILERRKKKALERREKQEAGFRFTRDGKLVVVDDQDDEDDRRKGGKRKIRDGLNELDEEDGPTQGSKRTKENSDSEDDEILSDNDEEEDDKKTYLSKAPSYGGKGIYRDTSGKSQVGSSVGGKRAQQKRKNDQQKQKPKQKGLQPFAYVPLRNKTAKQDVRQILKAKRKSGKGGGKKVTF
uniref:NUC173 domain-containing protein n=1 Tax=Caenorhabditis japonica TaxID=281687 RepID=A0A8R1DIW5_CAEJA